MNRRPPVTTRTRVFAVLGRPVAHSLSPVLHGAALAERQIDAVYVALPCGAGEVAGLVRGLALAGGGGNVTLPHKSRAAAAVDRVTPAVERTGACNTFWAADGVVWGDNTDVAGVRGAMATVCPGGMGGARVLLLGAGGAARAALAALVDEGAGEIVVLNRSEERARTLVRDLGGERTRVLDGPRSLEGLDLDLVIQATSLGLAVGDPLPVDLDAPARVGGVLDLVYGDRPTALVRAARERNIPAADGREMLVLQGAAAFRRWFGDPVPLEAMRGALVPAAP